MMKEIKYFHWPPFFFSTHYRFIFSTCKNYYNGWDQFGGNKIIIGEKQLRLKVMVNRFFEIGVCEVGRIELADGNLLTSIALLFILSSLSLIYRF